MPEFCEGLGIRFVGGPKEVPVERRKFRSRFQIFSLAFFTRVYMSQMRLSCHWRARTSKASHQFTARSKPELANVNHSTKSSSVKS
jgi:hypothetical protein